MPFPATQQNRKRRDLLAAVGFLSPNFLGFALFVAYPIIYSLYLVFTNRSLKPAIPMKWIGLANAFELLGFGHRPEYTGSDQGLWLVLWFVAWLLFALGVLLTLVAMNRKWNGIRAGGWLALATGTGLLALSLATRSHPGWGLFGVTWAMASVFLILDDDKPFSGPGLSGPLCILTASLGVHLLKNGFLLRWQAHDPLFWKYLYNTLFLMFLVPIQIAGSLALALILARPVVRCLPPERVILLFVSLGLGGAGFLVLWLIGHADFAVLWLLFFLITAGGLFFDSVVFRTLFFIPSFTAGVAIMLLWKQMFNPDFGILNEPVRIFYNLFNIKAELPRWIYDPGLAKPSLIVMGFWTLVGGTNMLVYLAGLAGIPEELYEASEIDGANRWQRFKDVTWPQLAPTTFYIVVVTTIAGIQGGFEQARVMTEGGPAGSTKTLSYYIYEKAFQELSMGYASAIAWIMFIMIFGLTALNWKFGNRYVNE